MRLTKQSKLQIRKYEQLLNKCGAGLEQLSKDFSGRVQLFLFEYTYETDLFIDE